MKKIILTGGYGCLDIGDESQLTAVLMNLRKFVPGAYLLVLSGDFENTLKYHDVKIGHPIEHYLQIPLLGGITLRNVARERASNRVEDSTRSGSNIFRLGERLTNLLGALSLIFNAKRLKKGKHPLFLSDEQERFLESLRSSDLLFNVGGGNLNSIWRKNLYTKCLMYILYRIFEKPIILSGQTIGPFYRWLDRFVARFALNRVNLITLREKISEKTLKDIGVTAPLIKVTADDGTMLIPENPAKVRMILSNERIFGNRPLIGMNMIGLRYLQNSREVKMKLEKAKELLARIADHLIDKYDATIIFVPMQYGRPNDDRVSASEVIQMMKKKHRAFILTREYDDHTIKGIIGQTDIAIGFRYHFIVFAVNSGVPAIGIYVDEYYATKIRGILDLVGQERFAFNIEEASFKPLVTHVDEIFEGKRLIQQELLERTKKLEKLSLLSIRYASRILSEQVTSPDTQRMP